MGKGPAFDALGNSKTALKFGIQAGRAGRKLSEVNQNTPYGSLKYSPGGGAVNVKFAPGLKKLFKAQNQLGVGSTNAAAGVVNANAPNWEAGPDLGPTADETGITKAITGWGSEYLDPILKQRRDARLSELQNQGIVPGSEAYTNATRDIDRGENDAMINLLLSGQGTALQAGEQNMQRGLADYNAPLGAYSTLTSGTQPPGLNFVQTPQSGVQTPDYLGAATTGYQAQQQNKSDLLSGLFRLPATALGGWASGAFKP